MIHQTVHEASLPFKKEKEGEKTKTREGYKEVKERRTQRLDFVFAHCILNGIYFVILFVFN